MEISEYKNIFENEESHFFYVANHNIILSLLKRCRPRKKNLKILDAGCGTGLLAKKLSKFGKVFAIDKSPEAVKYAKTRGVNAKIASVNKLPFRNNSFDIIVSIDVIYHKGVNDKKALSEFFRIARPNGILIIRVPANKWLKTAHDRHVHTRQRYDKDELREKLQKAGFEIKKLSFVNSILFPLAIFKHFFEQFIPPKESSSTIGQASYLINRVLIWIMSQETTILHSVDLPFGLGLIAVCKKGKH